MVGVKPYAIGLVLLAGIATLVRAAEPVTLRESACADGATRVKISLQGEGKYVATATATGETASDTKPLTLKVASELDFIERVLSTDTRGRARARCVESCATRPRRSMAKSDRSARRSRRLVCSSPSETAAV